MRSNLQSAVVRVQEAPLDKRAGLLFCRPMCAQMLDTCIVRRGRGERREREGAPQSARGSRGRIRCFSSIDPTFQTTGPVHQLGVVSQLRW